MLVMKTNIGFTLVELVMTIAVAAILASIAVPAYNDFVQDTRIVAETNEFVRDLYLARTEAVKRNRRVTVCKSTNPGAAAATCDTADNFNWSNGWIVFLDADADGVRDVGEVLLKSHQALGGNLQLFPRTSDVAMKFYVSYTPRGIAQLVAGGGTQNGIFRMCDSRGLSRARAIRVSQTGRVRAIAPTDSAALVVACP